MSSSSLRIDATTSLLLICVLVLLNELCSVAAASALDTTTTIPTDHHGGEEDAPSIPSVSQCLVDIESHYPKQYITYKLGANQSIVIDGKLDDGAWEEVGFSDRFVDISTSTRPDLGTYMKVRWDDEFLYVGGYIKDPSIWANITRADDCHCNTTANERNDQIIFHGNDFEVFVDADGTTRWYKELEINAANADWDVLLDRPYENNGYENSSRVFGSQGFDMVRSPNPMLSATYTDGKLNDPSVPASYWSVEIAFPLEKLAFKTTATVPPTQDDYWRINFSRVQWHVKVVDGKYELYPSCQSCSVPGADTADNWVWSPMETVNIHRPEMWGFLQFSAEEVNTSAVTKNIEWPARYVAHELYYAQVNYFNAQKRHQYTDYVPDLLPYATHPAVLLGGPSCTQIPTIQLNAANTSYLATIASNTPGVPSITIDENRLILAHHTHVN